jgi:hypothetical protein
MNRGIIGNIRRGVKGKKPEDSGLRTENGGQM